MNKKRNLTTAIAIRLDPASEANIQAIIDSGIATDKSAAIRASLAALAYGLTKDQSDAARLKRGCQVVCGNCGDTIFPDDLHEIAANGAVLCYSCYASPEEKRRYGFDD